MARPKRSVLELPPLPPSMQPDAPARLGERCASYVRGLLLDGGLEPGDPVSIDAVARAVGASRQPAMDAVKRLAAEGFITILPQVGCGVVRPEPEHVEDCYALFSASEGLLAKIAAERRTAEETIAPVVLQSITGPVSGGGRPASPVLTGLLPGERLNRGGGQKQ